MRRRLIARGAQLPQALYLCLTHGAVVNFAVVDRRFLRRTVFVDADDCLGAAVDMRLPARRRFFNAQFGHAGFQGLCHAAKRFDLLNMRPGAPSQVLRQALDQVGAAPRINDIANARFMSQVKLRIAGDARAEVAWQGDGFVQRVGMQRLRTAQYSRHGFDAGADDVIERLLLLQAPA